MTFTVKVLLTIALILSIAVPFGAFAAGERSRAVSYTHLDVYKRQVVFSELAAIRNKDILEDYVEQGAAFDALGAAGSPERKKASGQAGDLYKERMEDGSTFRFEYVYTCLLYTSRCV